MRVHHVVILGGRFAGLAALHWIRRLAGHRSIRLYLVTPEEESVYRPDLVWAARAQPDFVRRTRFPLSNLCRMLDATLILDRAIGIDAQTQTVYLAGRTPLRYDTLFWATGLDWAWELVPGLGPARGFVCEDYAARHTALRLQQHPQGSFVVAAGPLRQDPAKIPNLATTFDGPLYEMALLWAYRKPRSARNHHRISLVTPASMVGQELGPKGRAVLLPLLKKAHIDIHTGATVDGVEADAIWLRGSGRLPAQTMVWMPPSAGSRLARDSGLDDGWGWVPTREHLQHRQWTNIYAIGDLNRATLPKLGHTAMVQARVAVHHWWATFNHEPLPPPYHPTMVSIMEIGQGRGLLTIQDVLYGGSREWVSVGRIPALTKHLFGRLYRRGYGGLTIMP